MVYLLCDPYSDEPQRNTAKLVHRPKKALTLACSIVRVNRSARKKCRDSIVILSSHTLFGKTIS